MATAQQTPSSLFGKTSKQVTTMGLDNWLEYVYRMSGSTPKKQLEGAKYYASIRTADANAKLAKLPAARAKLIKDSVAAVQTVALNLNEAESIANGGGEQYTLAVEVRKAEAAESLFLLASGKGSRKEQISGNLTRELIDNWTEQFRDDSTKLKTTGAYDKAASKAAKSIETAQGIYGKLPEGEANFMRLMVGFYLSPEIKRPF